MTDRPETLAAVCQIWQTPRLIDLDCQLDAVHLAPGNNSDGATSASSGFNPLPN
ncbi:MAG: hypothetical protein ABIT10_09130 [Alteraurantiacibacter sp.]